MRRDGFLSPGTNIVELGAQVLVCHGNQQAVLNLFDAFGVPRPEWSEVLTLADGAPARALF